jgi:predicted dienelactone hydrolase
MRIVVVSAFVALVLAVTVDARPTPDARCLLGSGKAATKCVQDYTAAVSACRDEADAACETALRAEGGSLEELLAAVNEPTRRACAAESAARLTFLAGIDDLASRTAQACGKWSEDHLALAYADDLSALSPAARSCQRDVAKRLRALRDAVVRAFGRRCYGAAVRGKTCDRTRRDALVAKAVAKARAKIAKHCGNTFDELNLASGNTTDERIAALTDVVVNRGRHLAQRIFPPLDLGATGLFGPAPVGVRTLDLLDASRLNVDGTPSRPVKVEVYYPSTADAVAGVPRDIARALGIDLFVTPTHRDPARAPGTFPLVLFSPGQGSDPWQNTYVTAHLASHGYVVASIEHHGDHFRDTSDPSAAVNRPLDLTFALDELLARTQAPGDFFAGAIDGARVGAAGYSFGGYAAMALAMMCPFAVGDFADPRIKSIFLLDPRVGDFTMTASPAIFSTLTLPTLLLGGTRSVSAFVQPLVFDALAPGPIVMDFANFADADHGTWTDACEIPDAILEAFSGGPVPTCEPISMPWRYARYVIDYLALNFFDATLNADAEALARLDPAVLAVKLEDVAYESKADGCSSGESCSLTCAEAACGDGIVGPHEVCDPPGAQGSCAVDEVCNLNCTACFDCGGATGIPPDGGVVTGTTVGGTNVFRSSCGLDVLAPERLFQWTPSTSHVATIQTCGPATTFDTILYVREATCFAPDLACNDDSCGLQSSVTLPVVAGTTYYIVVDGFNAAAGDFALNVQ